MQDNQPIYPVERYITIGKRKYCLATARIYEK